jgi:hypothetical protein
MNYSPKQLATALGGEVSGHEVLAPGPNHSAKDRSMSVRVDPSAPDGFVVHSFAGDDPLHCKDHVRAKLGIVWTPTPKANGRASIDRMVQRVAPSPSKASDYVYELEDGTPYLRVRRTADKKFFQQHWTGNAWVNGAPDGPKIPYRLPQLLQAEHDTVLIVEGEKDADALAALGLVATTNAGGAEKWSDDLSEHFKGRQVYILPDNDEPGERHAALVAEKLATVAQEIRIVRLPGLPPKGDVSDWLAAGGTVEQIDALMKAAQTEPVQEDPSPILSSAEFLDGFIPPDYLIDGLIQRRFCYSLTAPTGHGKTAVALVLAASKALGRSIGKHEVEPGRVLYFAGENPDDVRMRWIVLSEKMGFDPKTIDVHFLPGTAIKLSEIGARIREKVRSLGGVSFVLIDTSAAYFEGDEENGNVQAGNHARVMRGLVSLPGEPCVLIMCHPVKNAGQDNLLPRGGGAFTAEVDGNLTCWKTDSLVSLHWQGKFRGPDFAPISFELETVTSTHLRDSKGRMIPSVVARPLSDQERSRAEINSGSDEDALLLAVADNHRASFAGLAVALGWISAKGENKAKVSRCADRLKADKLVKPDRRGTLSLTEKGETEVKRLRAMVPASDERFNGE